MCRSIKVLRNAEPPATRDDIRAAARQFIRKVSGFHKPSKANEAVFEDAIEGVAAAAEKLLQRVTVRGESARTP
jgi:hypothetical protein